MSLLTKGLFVLFALTTLGSLFFLFVMKPARLSAPASSSQAVAYFAGGCFWCTEADFQKVDGVSEVVSGYSGGTVEEPSYQEVTSETTGHRESVEVHYDPTVVTYRQLVEYFFDHIDPTDTGGQFHDRGESYTAAIFYQNEEEHQAAQAVVDWLTEHHVYDQPIVTALLPFKNFYPAENYHQNYSDRNSFRYRLYRAASGRDALTQKVCRIKTEKKLPCFTGKLKSNSPPHDN